MVHIWYLKKRPSYLPILLDLSRKQTESLVYCTESILNNIFPKTFFSIFYSYLETPWFSPIFRNIEALKKNLLLNNSQMTVYFIPTFQFELFVLQETDFDFSSITEYFGRTEKNSKKDQNSQEEIKNQNSQTEFKENLSININANLRSFLISDKYSKIQNKNFRKNKLSRLNQKNVNIKNKTRNSLSGSYGDFLNSYGSISKYLCWENQNPIKTVHFIYYMTSFPTKKDFLIYYYHFYNQKIFRQVAPGPQAGAQILNILLKELSQKSKLKNLSALERQIRVNLFEMPAFSSLGKLFQRVKLLRRLKLVWYFRLTLNKPSWMILSILPVLPADLRPIIQLEDNQIAVSDLNKLYQKVVFRNQRIQRIKIGHYSTMSDEEQYAQRLLQESVDSLIENGKGGLLPSSALNARPLKSLSDILKGKKGRFRQNLLGKRVDYSGRSVIVVGPYLQLHECGIPKEMALELFQPFLIRRLIFQKKARTILGAKRFLQQGGPMVQELLSETIRNYPVLLNRAPTLHRLSIQAFQPILVEGRAILLHPLVCSAFNADFDGDQMAVHIPLSYEARSEAWKLLWSQNNVLSPATGQPVLMPTQDMVLGWYYLTAIDLKNLFINLLKRGKQKINITQIQQIFKFQKITSFYQLKVFKKSIHVLSAYDQNIITFQTPIWFYWKGLFETDEKFHPTLEIRLDSIGNLLVLGSPFQFRYNWYGSKIGQIICTTAGRILLNYLIH